MIAGVYLPRTHRSTPPSTSRSDRFGESRKWSSRMPLSLATVHICNPRMSRAAHPGVASASRRSSLEPANAQRLGGFRVGSTRCYPTIESDKCPAVWARRCSHRLTPRGAARHEFGGMGNEALKPGQLVIEFRSRLRIPVGEVNGSDQNSLNGRFDVTGLVVLGFPASLRRSVPARGLAREWPRRSRNAPLAKLLRTQSFEGPSQERHPAPPSALGD